MVKVQARGITVDADGLGITLRVNGHIVSPVPVITLDINNGFKEFTTTADSERHHPSGGYTDIHYVITTGKIYPVDVVLANGIDNEPIFYDVPVAMAKSSIVSNDTVYDYEFTVGSDLEDLGYLVANFGSLTPKGQHFNKVTGIGVAKADGAVAVVFGDNGGEKISNAITIKFEGLLILNQDGTDDELYEIRLEWVDANLEYELAANASLVALATYLTNVEGATIGFGITYHN